MMPEINWLAAIVAGIVAGVGVGSLWYGPVFGKAWMAASGLVPPPPGTPAQRSPEQRSPVQRSMSLMVGGTTILSVLGAIAFAFFLGKVSPAQGALYGAVAGLFWAAGSLGISYLWEGKSLIHWLINGSYHTVQYTLIGLILGLWH
jgi:Protein of unknown function (DUF1761)